MDFMNSYVTCRLFGQLGNQLFQIATTLAYAWDYGAIPVFPELHKHEDRISYNRDRLFFRLDSSTPDAPFLHAFQETVYYSSQRIPYHPGLVLSGYFQSWKHFHHHKEKLLPLFTPLTETSQRLQTDYADLLACQDTVGVHIRTHSKHLHENGLHVFSGFQYIRDAMDLFPGATFVVFSDRMAWCKRTLPMEVGKKKLVFIEGNDAIEDLWLLSKMNHQIIGNSTYGWWAGYLNCHPDGKVISPKDWRDPAHFNTPPLTDFFLPNWTLLPVGFDHPYPKGLENEATTSVNN